MLLKFLKTLEQIVQGKICFLFLFEVINSRRDQTERIISELKDRPFKMHSSKRKKKNEENEQSLQEIWDSTIRVHIQVIWAQRGSENAKGI